MTKDLILAIDQGTTSSRAIVFSRKGDVLGVGQQEFKQYFPNDGWVEHDPEEIWESTLAVCHAAIKNAGVDLNNIAGIGITNQRETSVIWDRATGKPLYNAIVWQDRRTAAFCDELKAAGREASVAQKTGLLLDPYFSATKIAWILDQVEGARAKANAGDLAFGTIDSFLLWRLTGGKSHATDATNASRTLLFDIEKQAWDDDLLTLFNVPASLLPTVKDSAADFGVTEFALFGVEIPIAGIAGDQQAALIGQACFSPGMLKSTYGTGCFLMQNTGSKIIRSTNKLLSTVAYRLDGETTYATEGSIFIAGAAVQWLRDGLKLIDKAGETQALAESIPSTKGVFLVPAFTGLGAPHWDANARGAIVGLTRDTGIAEICRAALEAVCYQTRDLVDALVADGCEQPATIRVDGGMVANDWLAGFLADIIGASVERPVVTETTALGAAYLAGLQLGIYESLEQIEAQWQCERTFEPTMPEADREKLCADWRVAVQRVK